MLTLPIATHDWKIPVSLQSGGTRMSLRDSIDKVRAIRKQINTLKVQLEVLNNGLAGIPFEQIEEAARDLRELNLIHSNILSYLEDLNFALKIIARPASLIPVVNNNINLIHAMQEDLEILHLLAAPPADRLRVDQVTRKKLRTVSHRRLQLLAAPEEMDEEVLAWQNADLNTYLN